MSDRLVACSTCGTLGPEALAHNIPTHAPDRDAYVDGYYCEAHAADALAAARAHVTGLDLEDDERDDMIPLMLLVALLRARGQHAESLAPGEAPGEGMERIRQEALALLARLARGDRLPIVEATALCSGCHRPVLASQVRVIPCFNDAPGDYVTSFRCAGCWRPALAETRARLDAGTDRDVARLCEFFARHAIFVHEHSRGDPPATIRPIVGVLLDRIADGSMKLAIGPTVSIGEALQQALHASPPPSPAPPASPRATPAPPPSLWTRLTGALGRKRD